MKMLWVLTLGLATVGAVEGCKRKEPEPIPGPKARLAAAVEYSHAARAYMHTPGIAWFQGSLDEGFARPTLPLLCREHAAEPRTTELSRARKKLDLPSSEVPLIMRPRHRLV
jgi:hypothetical protein